MSLDIPSIDVNVPLSLIVMSRAKKQLVALSALFALEFLSLGFFTKGTFSRDTHYVPGLPKATLYAHARAAKLDSPAKADDGFVLESSGEPTPSSGVFLTAKENVGISHRSFAVSPLFFQIVLAPKVSRYISKSVLIL